MTDHDRVTINQNRNSIQIYFKKTFTTDSAFPLEAGDEAVAYVTDVGVHLVPLRNLAEVVDAPITVDPPPRAALPPQYRPPPTAEDVDVDVAPSSVEDEAVGTTNGDHLSETTHNSNTDG